MTQHIRLDFAPPSFRDDKDIVLKAVTEDYEQYTHVSDRLKKDKDVIATTLKNTPAFYIKDVLRWMNFNKNPLSKNKDFLLDIMKENPRFFFLVDLSFRKDRKFMLEAIKINHNFYNYADESLKEPLMMANGTIKYYGFINDAIHANPAVRYLNIPEEVAKNPYNIESQAGMWIQRVTIKHPYLPLHLTFLTINKNDLLEFKENLKLVTSLIKKSKIPNFGKVLKDNIYIANKENLKKFFLLEDLDNTSALYSKNLDDIFYVMPSKSSSIYDLVHEFGHKYHNTMIKDGMENETISSFYEKLHSSTCELPKIGDPLSNLREDWWNVKMATDEFYLSNIDGKNYIYKNEQGVEKVLSYEKIKELIICPSQYGSKSLEEWFAEMCALITLNKVKASMQKLADDFIQVLEREIK